MARSIWTLLLLVILVPLIFLEAHPHHKKKVQREEFDDAIEPLVKEADNGSLSVDHVEDKMTILETNSIEYSSAKGTGRCCGIIWLLIIIMTVVVVIIFGMAVQSSSITERNVRPRSIKSLRISLDLDKVNLSEVGGAEGSHSPAEKIADAAPSPWSKSVDHSTKV